MLPDRSPLAPDPVAGSSPPSAFPPLEPTAAAALFAGPGEVRAHARALDWSATPLGPVAGWSTTLRAVVRLCLDSPFPVNLWCGAARVLIYNDAYRRVLGAKHPAALGRPGAEVWAEIWDDVAPMFAQIDAGGPPVYAEDARFVVARAGAAPTEVAYFTFGLSPVRDDDGTIVAYFNPATETTARVDAETALASTRRRLDAALLAGEVGTFQWEIPDDRLWGDANFSRIFDIQLDASGAAPLEAYLAAIHPDDRDRVAALVARTVETGAPYETEYRIVSGADDGRRPRWVEVRGRVEYEHDADGRRGRPLRFPGVVQDVTRRHEAEAARRASEARYEALLTSIDVGFSVIEVLFDGERPVDYRILETNPAFARQSGFDGQGRRIRELAPDIEPLWIETYGRVASTGEPARVEAPAAAFGRTYEAFAYRVDAPELRRVAVLFTDVTASRAAAADRERLLAEAEAARREAEVERTRAVEANQAKAQFLAAMSHELRTPLNAIGGYAELMALGVRGPLTAEQREDLERIRRANQHLTGLVTDILNFAKLEAGQVEFRPEPLVLADVVADVETLVRPQLAAKGMHFAPAVAGAPRVRADAEKLRQILVNLLTNAIKFTDHGGRLTLGADADAGRGVVLLHVTDTGRGIAADRLDEIFEPFVQVDRHRTPEGQQGVGLGLAISRDLARGMGGELVAASTPGEGSTFTLTLPVA